MASAFSHIAIPIAQRVAVGSKIISWKLLLWGLLLSAKPGTVFWFSFVSMLSHGLLDAFTNGGLGVAFFWPLTSERYFFPWQVIEVSPISVARFFSERGAIVLRSEAFYIWLRCLLIAAIFYLSHRRSQWQKK